MTVKKLQQQQQQRAKSKLWLFFWIITQHTHTHTLTYIQTHMHVHTHIQFLFMDAVHDVPTAPPFRYMHAFPLRVYCLIINAFNTQRLSPAAAAKRTNVFYFLLCPFTTVYGALVSSSVKCHNRQ